MIRPTFGPTRPQSSATMARPGPRCRARMASCISAPTRYSALMALIGSNADFQVQSVSAVLISRKTDASGPALWMKSVGLNASLPATGPIIRSSRPCRRSIATSAESGMSSPRNTAPSSSPKIRFCAGTGRVSKSGRCRAGGASPPRGATAPSISITYPPASMRWTQLDRGS